MWCRGILSQLQPKVAHITARERHIRFAVEARAMPIPYAETLLDQEIMIIKSEKFGLEARDQSSPTPEQMSTRMR